MYQRGRTVRGQGCGLRYIANHRLATYRVAVVVSKKVHKSAVVRNRIRRRLYEIVRTKVPATKEPYDLVLIVYSDQLATMPFDQLQTLVLELLDKAGVVDDKIGPTEAQRVIVIPKEK